jgi:hypothetical protein
VASAGHVLKKRPYVAFGQNAQIAVPPPATTFLARECLDPPDIGFLEISRDTHHSACPFEAFSNVDLPDKLLVMLVGHPLDAPGSSREGVSRRKEVVDLFREAFFCVLKRAEDARYVFDYPEKLLHLDGDSGSMSPRDGYKSPDGFSGGGVWAMRDVSKVQGIIQPSNMLRLFAIDFAWRSGSRQVLCTPIKFWVRLIHNHYPDLHAVIEEQFPEISNLCLG